MNEARQAGPVQFLSEVEPVSMADDWYELATPEHFWMQRRHDILQSMLKKYLPPDSLNSVGEIGCGNGTVQEQFFRTYGMVVDGYDLNPLALESSIAVDQPRICYNVHECHSSLKNKYDLILLFDVIEHLEDDAGFVKSVLYHLREQGSLLINVPAFQSLFSSYDEAAGHFRRYDIDMMQETLQGLGVTLTGWTYWGFPMLPLLWMRKALLSVKKENIIQTGFKPPGKIGNLALRILSRLEVIPQHFYGTSMIVLVQKT
jgi:SAM-dependent methyltransferase